MKLKSQLLFLVQRAFLGGFLAFLATGCHSEAGPLIPVHGKVFSKSAPLHGGTIVFVPDANRGNNGPLAKGEIRADASYTLKTENVPGARPGWYHVTIMAMEEPPPGGTPFFAPRSLVPEKYRDPELSGLSCEVKAGQENGIDFDLE